MNMVYSNVNGAMITINDRDYFIVTPSDAKADGTVDLTYRMIYKDSEGKFQIRKFLMRVRSSDGFWLDISAANHDPIFKFLAGTEIGMNQFITMLCFGRENSFVIPDFQKDDTTVSPNVICYIYPIQ